VVLRHAALTLTLHRYSTGLPHTDAQWDFRRARRAWLAARLSPRARRRCRNPCALTSASMLGAGPSRLEVVPLREIVGTVEPTAAFDGEFRPATELVRRRWERIALAHHRGEAMPPVVLRRQPDGYYVVDGRHRVSVARTLRLGDIDAWVTGPQYA
jgi:hypothetical protein